jgi:hypothetical protein
MRFQSLSVRTKLLGLVASVALAVGLLSGLYSFFSSKRLLEEQVRHRGTYAAANLAENSRFGILTEDRTFLTHLLEGVVAAAGGKGSDVIGAVIRDAKGNQLAQYGVGPRQIPPISSESGNQDAVTADGENILLFHAPVMAESGGADAAADPAAAGGAAKMEQKGEVAVIISKQPMNAALNANLAGAVGVGVALFVVFSLVGYFVTGRWLRPIQRLVAVAWAGAMGALTQTLAIAAADEIAGRRTSTLA